MKDNFDVKEEKLECISRKGLMNYKSFKLFFAILSISILLSPAIYPLSNPFVNPNTPFENYPKALQEAYAESIAFTPSTERFKDYQIEHASKTTNYYKSGLESYVLDPSDKKYKDSFVTQNSTHIKLVNEKVPLTFKKSDCTIVIYTDSKFNTKFADYYSTMGLKIGTDAWTVFDALSLKCSFSTFQNATGQYLTVQRVHNKGVFDVTYPKLTDGDFKSNMKFKNNPDNVNVTKAGLKNTKVSFVEVFGNITVSQFLIDGQDKFASLVDGTQILFTHSNMTSKIFDIIKSTRVFDIDLGTDFSDLLAVRATKTSPTTLKLEIAFGKTAATIGFGETVQRDPTFQWKSGTVTRVTTTSSADTNCNSGSLKDNIAILYRNDSATSGNCGVLGVEFDVTAIPDGSNIRTASLRVVVDNVSNSLNCDINPITNKPSTTVASTLYTDITGAGAYVDNNNFCTTTGEKVINLGNIFDDDCEALLASDWCGVGISLDSLTRNANDIQTIFGDIKLELTYGTSLAPEPPSVTASGGVNKATLTITENSGNFDNSTQPAESSYRIYRSAEDASFYLFSALKNFGSDQEAQEGAIKQGTLGNTLLLHYDSLGTANGNTSIKEFHEDGGGRSNSTVTKISAPDFSDTCTSGWTQVGTTVSVTGGKCVGANDADTPDRIHKPLDLTLSNSLWIVEFEFNRTSAAGSNARPLCLTAGTGHPVTASQDSLCVYEDTNLNLSHKDGANAEAVQGLITVSQNVVYYVRWERISTESHTLKVFSDSARTVQVGSTITQSSISNVIGLTTIQSSTNDAVDDHGWKVDEIKIKNSASTLTGSATLVKGLFGNAINLNSANQNITSSDINIRGTNDWTFSTFVNMTNSDPFTLFSFPTSATRSTYMRLNDNSISLFDTGTSVFNYTISPSFGTSKVQHLAVTRSSGNYCVFVNGTQQSCATTNSTTLGTPTSDLYHINSNKLLTDYSSSNLYLEETAFYNTTLISAQLFDLASRGKNFTYYATSTIATNGTAFTDNGMTNGDAYCYVSTSTNTVGESAFSNVACATASGNPSIYIRSFEFDGSTGLTADIIQENTTAGSETTKSTNATFFAGKFSGVSANAQNYTQKETTDNFVTNKTNGLTLTANSYLKGLVFNISCPQNGAGNDVKIKINATDKHRISSHTTPTCITTGNNFNVTWDATFTADGNPSSLSNFTSSVIASIQNTTAFGKNAQMFRENGTLISTSYASSKITSESYQVGTGLKTVTISFNLALDPKPAQPSAPTVDCTTSATCSISWSAPNAGVDGIDGYKITRDGTVIVADTGSTTTSYSDTGLSASTTYSYTVSAINQYGTGQASSSANDSTGSGSDPVSGGSGGGGGGSVINPTTPKSDGIKTLTLQQQTHTLGFGISRTFPLELVWNTPENIKITKIIPDTASLGDIQIIPQEQPVILPGKEGATTENPSKGEILYTIIIPEDECRPPAIAINCAERRLYIIPLEISAVFDDRTVTSTSQIRIDLTGGLDYGLITIMAVGSVVGLSIVRYGRKRKGRASKRGYEKAIARNHHK